VQSIIREAGHTTTFMRRPPSICPPVRRCSAHTDQMRKTEDGWPDA
jgi:hypothetical protein